MSFTPIDLDDEMVELIEKMPGATQEEKVIKALKVYFSKDGPADMNQVIEAWFRFQLQSIT